MILEIENSLGVAGGRNGEGGMCHQEKVVRGGLAGREW